MGGEGHMLDMIRRLSEGREASRPASRAKQREAKTFKP